MSLKKKAVDFLVRTAGTMLGGKVKEISITDFSEVKIGQVEDPVGGTGCTVVIAPEGMGAGLDIRGGGPASRETGLMDPLANAEFIHAVLLGGGSAYGLDAAGGVMQYLEEQGIGLPVGKTVVPLVCQSDIFDLGVGDPKARPDKKMGYEAAKTALERPNYKDGNFGAGCGATVGKLCGPKSCMKAGIGSYAIQVGDLKIGAVVSVNAVGDIYDWKTAEKVAGVLTPGTKELMDTGDAMALSFGAQQKMSEKSAKEAAKEAAQQNAVTNTTIGIIITNGTFRKNELCKIAGMTHDGYARSIRPVHTSMDGDSIYAVSVGNVPANRDMVGVLAAEVMSEAILRAVSSAESAFGILSVKELTE